MIYSVPAQYTNTIYSGYVFKNAGGDQQLQLSTVQRYSGSIDATRCLISGCPDITKYQYDYVGLKIYPSRADLKTSEDIHISLLPITTVWSPGVSLDSFAHNFPQQGSTWNRAKTGINWTISGGDYSQSDQLIHTTSYRTIYTPIEFDVTQFVDYQDGFILKITEQTSQIGTLYLYSANTQTIFQPKYVAYVPDYYYTESTSSQSIVVHTSQLEQYIYSVKNINYNYNNSDIVRFQLGITPKVYSRDWTSAHHYYTTASIMLDSTLSGSYAVYDISQLERLQVVPHSQYTRISCDGSVNYFNFDMQILEHNKYYQIQIKVGNRRFINDGVFKVV